MKSSLPVAVVLSGCGVYDGTEITEAVGLLIALSQAGFGYRCYAPVREQYHVVDHFKGAPADGARNILTESARIARGAIQPLSAFKAAEHCALAFPGGFGAAKNLTTFIDQGDKAQLYADVNSAVTDAMARKLPLLALCAAPLVLGIAARDAGLSGVRLTFGDCEGPAMNAALAAWGQTHVVTPLEQACVDSKHRMISAPAYMYGDANPAEVFASIQAAVKALDEMLTAA